MLIHSTGDTLMYYYKNTNQEFYRIISYKGTRVIFDEQQKDYKEALRLYNHWVSQETTQVKATSSERKNQRFCAWTGALTLKEPSGT